MSELRIKKKINASSIHVHTADWNTILGLLSHIESKFGRPTNAQPCREPWKSLQWAATYFCTNRAQAELKEKTGVCESIPDKQKKKVLKQSEYKKGKRAGTNFFCYPQTIQRSLQKVT